jgi:hypothetical protein
VLVRVDDVDEAIEPISIPADLVVGMASREALQGAPILSGLRDRCDQSSSLMYGTPLGVDRFRERREEHHQRRRPQLSAVGKHRRERISSSIFLFGKLLPNLE